jgi:hypothetical protein
MRAKEIRLSFFVLATGVVALFSGLAHAGPPFRTDDPEPVDYRHYEFYTLSTGTRSSGDMSGVFPAFEYNYGIFPNAHVHVIVPAVTFDAPAGLKSQYG